MDRNGVRKAARVTAKQIPCASLLLFRVALSGSALSAWRKFVHTNTILWQAVALGNRSMRRRPLSKRSPAAHRHSVSAVAAAACPPVLAVDEVAHPKRPVASMNCSAPKPDKARRGMPYPHCHAVWEPECIQKRVLKGGQEVEAALASPAGCAVVDLPHGPPIWSV